MNSIKTSGRLKIERKEKDEQVRKSQVSVLRGKGSVLLAGVEKSGRLSNKVGMLWFMILNVYYYDGIFMNA